MLHFSYEICCDDLICNNVHESYVNIALGHASLIDHFIVSACLRQLIINCEILVPPDNFSDHRPVCVKANLPNVAGSIDGVAPGSRPVRLDHYRWDKANLVGYYEQSRLFLADVSVDNKSALLDYLVYGEGTKRGVQRGYKKKGGTKKGGTKKGGYKKKGVQKKGGTKKGGTKKGGTKKRGVQKKGGYKKGGYKRGGKKGGTKKGGTKKYQKVFHVALQRAP